MLRGISRAHVLAITDQGVVSGSSFLVTVILGRLSSPSELGVYALCMVLLQWFLTVLEALVSLPYTFQRHRPLGTPDEHAGTVLIHSVLLAIIAAVFLGLSAIGLSWYGESRFSILSGTLAAVVPFALLREFCRRFAFAHLQMANAVILDLGVALMQIGFLGWLIWAGKLSAISALATIGAGCALGAVPWLYLARASFTIRWDQLLKTMRQSLELGKWFFAIRLTSAIGGQTIPWFVAAIVGVGAAGIYAACDSIASLANPLIMGFYNIVNARAALAFVEGGNPRLWREARRDALLIGASLGVLCVILIRFSEDLLVALYGAGYAGNGDVISVLALSVIATGIGLPAASALTSIGHARSVFLMALAGDFSSLVLALSLVTELGVQGAAYAYLAGSIIRSAAWWARFMMLLPPSSPDGRLGSVRELPIRGT